MTLSLRQLELVAVTPDDASIRRRGLAATVADLIRGGVTAVMFREKSLDDAGFFEEARAVREACREGGAAFLLNERVHLTEELAPDALHLTFRSPDVATVRSRVGAELPLGRSTHSPAEAAAAVAARLAYVVHGPVMPTPSKRGLVEALGLDAFADVCRGSAIPVVAIGGVDAGNAARLRRSGAAGVAAIRALFAAADAEAAARDLTRGSAA